MIPTGLVHVSCGALSLPIHFISLSMTLYSGQGLNSPLPFLLDWLAVSVLKSLWRVLCRSQLTLKHSCEQKMPPWMLSLIQVGHWILAGLPQPGVPQDLPSIDDLCLVSATQDLKL